LSWDSIAPTASVRIWFYSGLGNDSVTHKATLNSQIFSPPLQSAPKAMQRGPSYGGTRMGASRHIASLDGLRGYAALLVVLSHFNSVRLTTHAPPFAGALGVLIFFVLSGFLMGHLYLWKPLDKGSVIHYVVARLARIVPLYYITLLVAFAISKAVGKDFIYYFDAATLVKQLSFAGSAYVFWSIPPEVQFYFLFIGVWWLVASGRAATWAPLVLLAVAAVFVIRPLLPGISALGQLQIFMTGVAVAAVRRSIDPVGVESRLVTVAQIIAVVAVVLAVSGAVPLQEHLSDEWHRKDTAYGYLPLVLTIGAALLAISFETSFSQAVFANPIVTKLGAFSFSLYLLHEPVLDIARRLTSSAGFSQPVQIVSALSAAIAVAAASYYAIEMPAQKFIRASARTLLGRLNMRTGTANIT
jgi:peptidoglycan/LPS O-acetylase OafA/YrhL